MQQGQGPTELEMALPLAGKPEVAALSVALEALAEAHGLPIALQEQHGSVLRVTCSSDWLARDAVSLLEARFANGPFTAVVPQIPGQVQRLLAEPAWRDFQEDLWQLAKEECKDGSVVVGHAAFLLAGADEAQVVRAQGLLKEMLSFYLPEAFEELQGLDPCACQRLKEDGELTKMREGPDCIVTINEAQGSLWLSATAGVRTAFLQRAQALMQAPSAELPLDADGVTTLRGSRSPGSRSRSRSRSSKTQDARAGSVDNVSGLSRETGACQDEVADPYATGGNAARDSNPEDVFTTGMYDALEDSESWYNHDRPSCNTVLETSAWQWEAEAAHRSTRTRIEDFLEQAKWEATAAVAEQRLALEEASSDDWYNQLLHSYGDGCS